MKTEEKNHEVIHIGIGGLEFARKGIHLKTTLGSCIAVIMFEDPDLCEFPVASMCHYLLPSPGNQSELLRRPRRFGSFLMQLQYQGMLERGARRIYIKSKIAGGSTMLKEGTQAAVYDIGRLNSEVAVRILNSYKVKIIANDTGGTSGRSVEFNPGTAVLKVRVFGGDLKDI